MTETSEKKAEGDMDDDFVNVEVSFFLVQGGEVSTLKEFCATAAIMMLLQARLLEVTGLEETKDEK